LFGEGQFERPHACIHRVRINDSGRAIFFFAGEFVYPYATLVPQAADASGIDGSGRVLALQERLSGGMRPFDEKDLPAVFTVGIVFVLASIRSVEVDDRWLASSESTITCSRHPC
jgi:hypothetical protein